MLRTFAIVSNQIVLSFGVFDSILITKAIQDWGESIESMAKQLEAHLHEEPKLWSFIVLFQKQIMNVGRESKERNLTWRIKDDRNYWTHLEHFLESISCILYVVSKLGKSGIQRFKRCVNWSWNEEIITIGSQSHQAESWFRSYEITRC